MSIRRSIVLPAATCALLLAAGGCSVSVGGEDAPAAADVAENVQAVVVEVAPVTRQPISASITGTAALEARRDAQVVAKTSGIALAVLVEEGQSVREGQPLLRLDPDRARLAVEQTRAQLQKLENNYQRAQTLVQEQLISNADFDQIRFDLDDARARHRMAALELSYTTVAAPISGVVASRDIKPGNFVQINSPILRIVDLSQLEATLNIPERDLANIKAGQTVELSADALPGRVFAGVVDRVSPVVDTGTGTFRVVAAFSGTDGLQPGLFARLRIQTDRREDALVIPRAALLDEGGDLAVYVAREGKAVRTAVTPGYEQAGQIEIRTGLGEGERVIITGKAALRDGSAVEVVERDGQTASAPAAGE